MAVYKVPQDVEADDKLLGPLSFRQFIYAVVAVVAIFIAYLLSQIFIGLIIIPLPIIALFTILALPLRKDQPMEMYLIAIIQFMLKPRVRLWQPEGQVALVEIIAPRVVEEVRTNGLSQDQARSQLDYLAQLMDSRGWSAKGTQFPNVQQAGPPYVADSDITNDIMDKDASVARNFNNLLAQNETQRQQEMRDRIAQSNAQYTSNQASPAIDTAQPGAPIELDDLITQQQQKPPARPQSYPTARPSVSSARSASPLNTDRADSVNFDYNPYPRSIHQQIIQPADPSHQQQKPKPHNYDNQKAQASVENPMTSTVSPDIMRLATESKNLSISTIAHEAQRLQQKQDEKEVVISLH